MNKGVSFKSPKSTVSSSKIYLGTDISGGVNLEEMVNVVDVKDLSDYSNIGEPMQ